MGIEIRPTEKELEYINKYYGIKKAEDMASELNISIHRVYNICRFIGFKKNHVEIYLNDIQHQLILGGILGDGNIKQNGSNCYYRETHGRSEKEYIYWKYTIMSEYVSKSGFHITDKRDNQYGFQTINSPTFTKYKNMTKLEVIDNINEFGLLIYLLDDGWRKGNYGYYISTGILDNKESNALVDRLNTVFDIESHLIQHNTIAINKPDIPYLLPYFVKYIPNNIDIFKKKIQPFVDRFIE